MTATDSIENTPPPAIECHFTEGFYGQEVRLLHGDEELAKLTLRTRMQTGLAHVERLKIKSGEEVKVEISDLDLVATIQVDAATPFVTVALEEGELRVASTATTPGYL